jgi:crotonobetainyl-CoA:carnitine CoA-transferase CaiB-like acyl-CoA transferase
LQAILTEVFKSRTTREWIEFGNEHNTPIAPINTPKTIVDDPQFQHRFQWIPTSQLDADMLGYPVKFDGADLAPPSRAPKVGEHTDEVLARFAGYDAEKIDALREAKTVN